MSKELREFDCKARLKTKVVNLRLRAESQCAALTACLEKFSKEERANCIIEIKPAEVKHA